MSDMMYSSEGKSEKKAEVEHNENGLGRDGSGLAQTTLGASGHNAYEDAATQETLERNMTMREAVARYPWACFWAFIMAFTIIMESFDIFLIGNFIALPYFAETWGQPLKTDPVTYSIPAKWQTGLTIGGQAGAFLGIFLSGPITNRYGYRIATMAALVLLIATIFISFFANSLPLFLVGQLSSGLSWGCFIANAPAYASEVVPLPLRPVVTAFIQMCWAFGSIIVGGVTYAVNKNTTSAAWKIPIAIQWIFPVPLLVIMWFMPESPWWLLRRGRNEQAMKSIKRLGRQSRSNPEETFAMMQRTVEIEAGMGDQPTYADLFKGPDFRRTAIICCVYAGQIANQAVFFFEQAGIATSFAFALGIITSSLQVVGVAGSWVLSSYFGRRTIYLGGTAVNIIFLIALGVAGTVTQTKAASFAQAVFGILISFQFCLTIGPIAYAIIAETSSVRLRPLSTGFGRAAYYVVEIPCIFLNQTGWALGGKCGYVWAGTALVCFVAAYFGLPELRHRSYRESDILFRRKVSARKFASTQVNIEDVE